MKRVDPHAWQRVTNTEIYVKHIAKGAVRTPTPENCPA